jgi:lipopolysaccharide biosynthesis glycosyltransferase
MMKYNSAIAHVVYALDDKFAELLEVSLVSLYENSRDMNNIVVYVLDSGIEDEDKEKLLSVCKSYN